jgi:hypothetical protein
MGQVQCLALVVCERVIEDKRTDNKSLIGLFNAVVASSLPAIQSLSVFVSVSGMEQLLPLSLKLVAPGGVLADLAWEPHPEAKTSPEAMHEFVIQMPGLELPEAGVYWFELWQGEEQLAKRGFTVIKQDSASLQPVAKG